jgi:hypothetical protein
MRIATVTLESCSPYGQGRFIVEKKSRDETHEDFENRIWRERTHYDSDGMCFIPPMAFKNSLAEAAKYKSEKIPGEGNAKWTKHFDAGVLVVQPLSLGVKKDDVQCTSLHLPSDGRPGGSTRVLKHMPTFQKWGGDVEYLVLDDKINEDVFERYVEDSGTFIGIGVFRPRNRGYWGRFDVNKVTWKEA